MVRKCTKCLENYEDFGQKHCWCKPCRREYDRNRHLNLSEDEKAAKISKAEARKNVIKAKVLQFLTLHPCPCGENRIPCLQFHHTNPHDKVAAVSDLLRKGCSWETIEAEIKKCEVLCANCHAIKTAIDLGYYSAPTGSNPTR